MVEVLKTVEYASFLLFQRKVPWTVGKLNPGMG